MKKIWKKNIFLIGNRQKQCFFLLYLTFEHFEISIMFAKIESYISLIQDQLRNPELKYYDKSLEVYAPKALAEYKMYLSQYEQWEASGNQEIPKLVAVQHMTSE